MPISTSEYANLWHKVLDDLKGEINNNIMYSAFLEDSYIHKISGSNAVIVVNSDTAQLIIEKDYLKSINNFLKKHSNENIVAKIISSNSLKIDEEKEEEVLNQGDFFLHSQVNSSLTFDNFIVGHFNRQAKQAALYIASNPGKVYNPLFIYSQSGLGKTHLLHAIANYIKDTSSLKVLYCSADDFFTEYIRVVRGEKGQDAMKNYIGQFDVLLIDDIQFFSGKSQTETFFFQVFQRMQNAKKQIVITSDKHPNDLNGFEERLTSRFASGLVMNIDAPDVKTCVEILKSKINSGPLDINTFDESVLNFIAEKFSKSVRSLDEALNRIIFYTTSFKPTKQITMEIAMEALQNLIDIREAKNKINEDRIISAVAEYYSLTPSQLTGTARQSEIALPRHIAMFLIRDMLGVPYTKIGYIFGGKDHTTVMHGVEKVEKELKNNTAMQSAIETIKTNLKR